MERIKLGIGLGFQTRRRVWGGWLEALGRGAAWTTHIAKLWAGLRLKIPGFFFLLHPSIPYALGTPSLAKRMELTRIWNWAMRRFVGTLGK